MQRVRFSVSLGLTVFALIASTGAGAAMVMDFTERFGTTAATGSAPWLDATFSQVDANTVRLTVDALGSLGQADVTELYFNLNPSLNPASLTYDRITPVNDSLGAITVSLGADTYRADGDGFYDIWLDLPTGDNAQRLNAGESLVFEFSYAGGLTVADFFFLSAPGPSEGNPGPFLAAAHLQSTGYDLESSDWVAAVPLPAAVWLLGSSLGIFGFALRRRRGGFSAED